MKLNLVPLRSSSKGNVSIVFNKNTRILVDCGISGKALEESLSAAGIGADSIDAIAVTHEHSDHIKGVGIISRKYNIPIFANGGTWRAMRSSLGKIKEENIRVFETGSEFYINDIRICAYPISHDAAEPVGYTFSFSGEKVAVATDMGTVTDAALEALSGCHTVLLEANYDLNMLEIGSYPYDLKCRIKGKCGHLDNCDSAALAKILAESGTENIILGHLSEENNYPPIAFETVREGLCGFSAKLSVVLPNGIVAKY